MNASSSIFSTPRLSIITEESAYGCLHFFVFNILTDEQITSFVMSLGTIFPPCLSVYEKIFSFAMALISFMRHYCYGDNDSNGDSN